jgi:hypothetical protein
MTRKSLSTLLPVTLLTIACSTPGRASSIAINNPRFETPTLTTGTYGVGVTGWNSIDGGGFNTATHNPNPSEIAGGVAPDGSNIAMISANNLAAGAGITQTLTATLLADTTYTLTFDVIHLITTTMDPYLGSFSANGVTLASDSSLNPALTQFALDTIVYNSGSSPAELGQALVITLQGTGCNSGPNCTGGTVGFDNVQLTAVTTASGVPEPATFGFFAAGLVFFAIMRRAKRA